MIFCNLGDGPVVEIIHSGITHICPGCIGSVDHQCRYRTFHIAAARLLKLQNIGICLSDLGLQPVCQGIPLRRLPGQNGIHGALRCLFSIQMTT